MSSFVEELENPSVINCFISMLFYRRMDNDLLMEYWRRGFLHQKQKSNLILKEGYGWKQSSFGKLHSHPFWLEWLHLEWWWWHNCLLDMFLHWTLLHIYALVQSVLVLFVNGILVIKLLILFYVWLRPTLMCFRLIRVK